MLPKQWLARIEDERRAHNLTACEALALRAIGLLLLAGDTMPSEARLANEAGVSIRTVQRAKAAARRHGLLVWARRFTGARLRQEQPCTYAAIEPAEPVQRRARQKGAVPVRTRSAAEQLRLLGVSDSVRPALSAADRADRTSRLLALDRLNRSHARSAQSVASRRA